MGRKIPIANDPSQTFHQTLSLSVFLAGMAAAIAISAILCGVRFKRKSESPSNIRKEENQNHPNNSSLSSPTVLATKEAENPKPVVGQEAVMEIIDSLKEAKEKETQKKTTQVSMPSYERLKEAFPSKNGALKKSLSTKNLAKNISMKIPRSMSLARKEGMRLTGKLKTEDSVWTKTIILGEKCKVSDEDEGVIYDPKGNRISAYHPKTPYSFNSFSDKKMESN